MISLNNALVLTKFSNGQEQSKDMQGVANEDLDLGENPSQGGAY